MIGEATDLVGKCCGQGRYHVKRRLGEGGMAYVLLARDKNLDIDVVLKIPKPIILADPEFAYRFKREIRSMVALVHPHILKIKDVGEHEGLPFYVMDLLTGGSLEDRFSTKADGTKIPMPPDSLLNWLQDVADALDFMHRRFVHRDIKPANILFDADGDAFVSDFGIVKTISDSANSKKQTMMTQAGMVLGTGPYMAPEVSLGEKYDGRADQYALAVTVYEVLSGNLPFPGTTLQAIILQQTSGKIQPLHDVVPSLPKQLSQAVVKGLSQDPQKRFASCAAFASAVLATATHIPGREGREISQTGAGPKVPCPSCRKTCILPPNPAGKRVTCEACRGSFTVAKRSFDKEAPETSRSPASEVRTRLLREKASPVAAVRDGPRSVFSRRIVIWVGLAIAMAAVGLVLFIAILGVVLLLTKGNGPKGERPTCNNPRQHQRLPLAEQLCSPFGPGFQLRS